MRKLLLFFASLLFSGIALAQTGEVIKEKEVDETDRKKQLRLIRNNRYVAIFILSGSVFGAVKRLVVLKQWQSLIWVVIENIVLGVFIAKLSRYLDVDCENKTRTVAVLGFGGILMVAFFSNIAIAMFGR